MLHDTLHTGGGTTSSQERGHKTPPLTTSLVQRQDDPSFAIFWPMTGDGTFGEACWAAWERKSREANPESAGDETKLLTREEVFRLCDLHKTHLSWWVMRTGGAFMVVKPYSEGVCGQSLTRPTLVTDSDGGGSLV